jgi:pyruvate/2-oxoglutarate dehydrogenase complex dihydrolipoamide acyltransferase (E2) component
MNEKIGSYQVVEFPPERRAMPNFLDMSWRKHSIYGLFEVDVTAVKNFIEEHRAQTGESLSLTGYLVFCLARALDQDKSVQAYRKGSKQLVLFDDVNIWLAIERKIGERNVVMGHVVRGANSKTYREIYQEIRSKQTKPVPEDGGGPSWFGSAMLLPWPLSTLFNALFHTVIRRDPTIWASMAVTVGVTAVGMFSKDMGGWGLMPAAHALDLVVGGITLKPAVVDGQIEPRDILNLTMVFDHDVIDGAPATRFAQRYVELV